ncbi:cytochrome C [Caldimicrobium thiodismutans]|uniref:Cytochrome C n=1 Tax=Caldimicrobium thiodismutans TaxID=1653476 RepID=A0A0U5AW31_9BACT|nr:cytochrome ubiquinol oxidase subunit I [Caldimicrobium thiodismutans]BAU23512.1 cytochrome C [Caldimicrobium thiodismutans]
MYPIWEVPYLSSALVIGLIASFHVLPSHLAVAALWVTVFIEKLAYARNRLDYLDFVKRFTLLLLIFSFIFGSLSGIGIWYSATVSSPRGISGLIHNYVWGWATEWVFFLIEIATIYAYYYTLGKVDPKTHIRIGYLYAIAAWISMIIITGILAFMLTPGKWLETGDFFDGFFNPTYFPQLFARTFLMFGVAGIYGLVITSTLKENTKSDLTKIISRISLVGMILGGLFIIWYSSKLPQNMKDIYSGLPYLVKLGKYALASYLILSFYFILTGFLIPRLNNFLLSFLMIIIAFLGILCAEGIREGLRRPYIINYFMYGHQVVAKDLPAKNIKAEIEIIQKEGLLPRLGYLPESLRKITPENRLEVGRIIALHNCANCHAFTQKGIRPLPALFGKLSPQSPEDIDAFLSALGSFPYMPPFAGNDEERKVAAEYLFTLIKK